jgi:hypothetical protein
MFTFVFARNIFILLTTIKWCRIINFINIQIYNNISILYSNKIVFGGFRMDKILTLDDATRSSYGARLYDFRDVITHPLRWDEVQLEFMDSTFTMDKQLKKEVSDNWNKTLETKPNAFDAGKTRFEGVEWKDGNLLVWISTGIFYSQHETIRKKPDLKLTEYPTPMTINDLQETIDGYLLFGVRNPYISDQSGGAVIGAGFHDPLKGKRNMEFPGGIFETAIKEAREETEYVTGSAGMSIPRPIDTSRMRAITLARGSNTDLTMGFYMGLTVPSDAVNLNRINKEYDLMLKVENSRENLERILKTGNLQGTKAKDGFVEYTVPLADHPIGVVEAFLRFKDRLPRGGYTQH